MSLSKRLSDSTPVGPAGPSPRTHELDALRLKIHQQIIEDLGPTLYDRRFSEDTLQREVEDKLRALLGVVKTPLSEAERTHLVRELADDILGYGPINGLLHDPDITEVMVNGPDRVYIERKGRIIHADASFVDETHVRRIIDKIVAQVGRRIDESTPMVDARLPDGSRVNAVIHPLAIGGPFLTIRKFSADAFSIDDLIRLGTINEQASAFLDACVRGRLNIVISGGTGSGKTTTLNVLSSFIPDDERIVTIEDAKELSLHQEHVLSMESRPTNIEGRGEVTIRDLVRNALRMRPDRIVVGEARSGEALDMLQAMNTGHDGSITTVHSNSPRDTLARVETMTLMAGLDLPIRAIRDQMASALDLVVHVSRLRDGTRRITHVTEVQGMEGDVITMQDIYLFDWGMGVDAEGTFLGHLKPTGMRPRFTDRLRDQGITLPAEWFQPTDADALTRY